MLAIFLIDEPVLVYQVESSVFTELCKRVVDLLSKFIVAFLYRNGVFLHRKRLGKNGQTGVLGNKILCGRGVYKYDVDFALLERFDSIGTLVVLLNGGVGDFLGIGHAGGAYLDADGLAGEVV